MASEVLMFLFAVYHFQAFTTLTLATFPKQNFEFIYLQLEPEHSSSQQRLGRGVYVLTLNFEILQVAHF